MVREPSQHARIAFAPSNPPARRRSRVHYALTREGATYFVIIALIAAAALNTGNNLLFLILAVLLAGIVISVILAKLTLSGFEMEVQIPDRIFALDLFSAQVTFHNLNRILPAYSISIRKSGKGDSRRFPQEQQSQMTVRSVFAPFIPPGGSVTETVDVSFSRRGRYLQPSFEVSSKFPFSILRRRWNVAVRDEIIALPTIRLAVASAAVAARIRGEMANRVKGAGSDLYALRDYSPGDPARDVNWKATAKRGQLMVREFVRDNEAALTLYLDNLLSAPQDKDRAVRFERAVSLCASLAWAAYLNGWALRFVGGGVQIGMARAADVIYRVLEALAVIGPARDSTDGSLPLVPITADNPASAVVITDRPDASLFKGWVSAGQVIAMEDL